MATYPFGLREDPFAEGFELSLAETRHLVQNRVSAFGGDGAALFPPETCAEIHRRAHGVAGAALKLTEHALLRAAREGAAVVLPAHVLPETAETRAAGAPVPAPEAEAPPASAPAIEAAPTPVAAAAPTPPPRLDVAALRSSLQAAIAAQSQPAPDAPTARPASVPATPPLSPPRLEVITSPRVQPEAAAPAGAPDLSDRTWSTRARSASASGESTPWTASVGVFLVFVTGTVLLVVLLHPAGPAMQSFARTSIAARVGVPPPPVVRTREPVRAVPPEAPAVVAPAPAPAPAPKPAASAPAESSRVDVPEFGLEVATFIVRERARAERNRLTADGRTVRIVTGWENGAGVYRVVVGPFASTAEAEGAADQMLERGLVGQARVVTLKPPTVRP